jgi:hypothetical protein
MKKKQLSCMWVTLKNKFQEFSIYETIVFLLIRYLALLLMPNHIVIPNKINCGTGNESTLLFGHTAVRVQDATTADGCVQLWGLRFSYNFVEFAKGDLQYFWLWRVHYTDFYRSIPIRTKSGMTGINT